MLSPLRLRLHFQRAFQHQLRRQHISASPQRLRPTTSNFFSSRPVSKTSVKTNASKLNHGVIRRTFASGHGNYGGNPYAGAESAIWTIIIGNGLVFAAWRYAIYQRDNKLLQRLNDSFLLSLAAWKDGRVYTLVTSAFSHISLTHFAFNMMSFHAFSSILGFCGLGASHIYSLAFGSAVAGSAGFLYHTQQSRAGKGAQWQMENVRLAKGQQSALGASGMVMGFAAAATCLMPFASMQLFFLPVSIPLWALTAVYFGVDAYYLDSGSSIGHSAHLGGSVFGAAFYFAFLRKFGGVWHMLKR